MCTPSSRPSAPCPGFPQPCYASARHARKMLEQGLDDPGDRAATPRPACRAATARLATGMFVSVNAYLSPSADEVARGIGGRSAITRVQRRTAHQIASVQTNGSVLTGGPAAPRDAANAGAGRSSKGVAAPRLRHRQRARSCHVALRGHRKKSRSLIHLALYAHQQPLHTPVPRGDARTMAAQHLEQCVFRSHVERVFGGGRRRARADRRGWRRTTSNRVARCHVRWALTRQRLRDVQGRARRQTGSKDHSKRQMAPPVGASAKRARPSRVARAHMGVFIEPQCLLVSLSLALF